MTPTPNTANPIAPIAGDTLAFTSPVTHTKTSPPSWARFWRQLCFVPFFRNRWLTPEAKNHLTQAVTHAEQGHRGEVFMVIENTLPLTSAREHSCHERAIDLFSLYRIWDTEENTGVLIYLNVCERHLQIVADRGINSQVLPTVWQAMCDKAIEGIKADKPVESLQNLLADIGQLLRQHYHNDDPNGNELPNEVVYLR